MNLEQIIRNAQAYTASLISNAVYQRNDSRIGKVNEPVLLNNRVYELRFLKTITGYIPNEKTQLPFLYTFFLIYPISPQNQEAANDEEYSDFRVGNPEFDKLSQTLKHILESVLYENQGFSFEFMISVRTKNNALALVFAEINSIQAQV